MGLWRSLLRGVSGLIDRAAVDRDAADEVEHFLSEATAAGIERGLSAETASHEARLQLGNPTLVQEQVCSYGWENSVRSFFFDFRYAARQLRKHPGFTAVSALTLALGMGASTAIFDAVNPILFKPLPYPHPDRILMIWNTYRGARFDGAFGTYLELAARSRSFSAMAAFEPWQPALTGGTRPERLEGQSVNANFFSVLGVSPTLGRDFQPSDDVLRGPKVVILSDRLWERLFQRDRTVIGRTIKLNDDNFTVIGVMPGTFESVLSRSAEVWTTEQYDTGQIAINFNTVVWGDHLRIIGRVRPGVSRDAAKQELDQIARTPRREFPRPRWASLTGGLLVDSLQDDMASSVKPALLAIMGAVALVLAIACVNVINLLLARGAQRHGELALRAALGASRTRIVRQLITESLLLALLGGALGIGIAAVGVRALIELSPPGLPRAGAAALNPSTFAFALGIATLAGLATGVLPALSLSRDNLSRGLQQSSQRIASSHERTRHALVIAEVALALILLTNAGLLLRSTQRILAVDPGFDPSHLLTLQVQTSGHQFDNTPAAPDHGDVIRRQFFQRALERVRHVPGVERAAFTSLLPLSDDPPVVGLYGSHFENDEPQGGHNVFRYAVSAGYCQTMGIPLRAGRYLDEHDTSALPRAALISDSLAKRQFPAESPIGKRLHVGPNDQPWYTVVGVVGEVKQTSLAVSEPDAVYISTEQSWFADDTLSFVVRTYSDPVSMATAIKQAIWAADKDQPIVRVLTMQELVAASESERHFVLILFEAFGAVALALAAVGIYGVLSASVNERTHEIGIRTALGASLRDILQLIIAEAMSLLVAGIGIGLLGAALTSPALTSLLYGISGLDPVTYLGVVGLLSGVATIACSVPASRAARVDPCLTLDAE